MDVRRPRSLATRISLVLAALGLTVTAAAAQPAKVREQLEQAQKELRANNEPSVRSGAQLARSIDTREALDMLLVVLDGTQPHFRDIVWEELPAFTDAAARKRVDQEMRTTKKPEVREWCAELIGLYADAAFGPSLEPLMRDRAPEVQRAAARSLGQLRHEAGSKALEAASKSKDVIVRANAIEALARIQGAGFEPTFLEALSDPDAGVRCALLGVLPELYPDMALGQSLIAVNDEEWRPRIQAVMNLGKIPGATSVEALIRAARDARPVVREQANAELRKLTGQEWTVAEQWESWWPRNKEGFLDPAKKASTPGIPTTGVRPKDYVDYNGLRVVSDHVAFLIDKSGDMNKQLASEPTTKSEKALQELGSTLSRLPESIEFEVFTYNEDVTPFETKHAKLEAKNAKAALAFIRNAPNTGSKNIWLALSTVMQNPDIDTIYLLSSGEPEVGLYVHWNRVTAHLQDLNRFHRVVIHTIAYSGNKWYRDQLEKIAQCTGGQFTYRE